MIQLRDVPAVYRQINAMLDDSGGEVTPEIQELFDGVAASLSDAVDHARTIVREAELSAAAFRDEASVLNERARVLTKRAERWKEWLLNAMKAAGTTVVQGQQFRARMVASRPSVVVDSVEWLPDRFVVVSRSPNREALYEAWREGEELPAGVHMHHGHHVRFS